MILRVVHLTEEQQLKLKELRSAASGAEEFATRARLAYNIFIRDTANASAREGAELSLDDDSIVITPAPFGFELPN